MGSVCLACANDVAQSHAGLGLWAGIDKEERRGVDGTLSHETATEKKPMVYVFMCKGRQLQICFDTLID